MGCMTHFLNRRGFFGAVAAAGIATLPAVTPSAFANTGSHVGSATGRILAVDLELLTLGDTYAVLYWTTILEGVVGQRGGIGAPADTEVLIDGRQVYYSDDDHPLHRAVITGLEPGRTYTFECRSNGVRATPNYVVTNLPETPERTGRFTTLMTPPGDYVDTFAIVADSHIGDTVRGAEALYRVPQPEGAPPHPEAMLAGAIADLKRKEIDLLLLAGDVTEDALPEQVSRAHELLNTFGEQGRDYYVVRGNHDLPEYGVSEFGLDAYRGCGVAPNGQLDCFGDYFGPKDEVYQLDKSGLRIIGYDSSTYNTGGGSLTPGQHEQIESILASDPDRPTLMFGHHPVGREAAFTNVGGPTFVLDLGDADRLQRAQAAAPGVFLNAAGHTHRQKINPHDHRGDIVNLEVGAIKEFPGGYVQLDLYTGGYMATYHRPESLESRLWVSRSRDEFFGVSVNYFHGRLDERNFTRQRDFSGLRGA